MGFFKDLGNAIGSVASIAVAPVAYVGAKAVEIVSSKTGADNIPALGEITKANASATNILDDLGQGQMPAGKDVGQVAKGVAVGGAGVAAGSLIGGAAGFSTTGAIGGSGAVGALLNKKPGSINSILSSYGGDVGSIAGGFLSDPYAPVDASGNLDVEGALEQANYDKSSREQVRADLNKNNLTMPIVIGVAGIGAAYLIYKKGKI